MSRVGLGGQGLELPVGVAGLVVLADGVEGLDQGGQRDELAGLLLDGRPRRPTRRSRSSGPPGGPGPAPPGPSGSPWRTTPGRAGPRPSPASGTPPARPGPVGQRAGGAGALPPGASSPPRRPGRGQGGDLLGEPGLVPLRGVGQAEVVGLLDLLGREVGPVEGPGGGGGDQVVPELVAGQGLGPAEPARALGRAAVVGPVLLGVAGLLDEVPGHDDGVAGPADVAERGGEPLVVVGVVVDLEGHDPVADHVGVVNPGRSFLLIGGVGVALELGVGVAGHVPGVGDPGGGPGVERRRPSRRGRP